MTDLIRRRTLILSGLAGVAATASGCVSDDSTPGGNANCFTASEDNRRLDGLRVFQQALPPTSDGVDASYPYWPCTDAVTAQDLGRSSWTEGNTWALVWANRCNYGSAWNKKPNPLPPPVESVGRLECRATFTTHARANAATRCRIRYLLGMTPEECRAPWLALAGTSSADFVDDAAYRRHPGTYCRTNFTWADESYRVMTDKVLLPSDRLTDGSNADNKLGVVLDYECQDSRSPEITEAFVHGLADDLRNAGKYLFFLTNPFNAPTQRYTGCTATNLPRIFADVDHMGVFVWSDNPDGALSSSYATQLGMLGPLTDEDYGKLVAVFELGDPGTTPDDARWLHSMLHASGRHPDKVMFWRNHVSQGGPCDTLTNQKISMVCFGVT